VDGDTPGNFVLLSASEFHKNNHWRRTLQNQTSI